MDEHVGEGRQLLLVLEQLGEVVGDALRVVVVPHPNQLLVGRDTLGSTLEVLHQLFCVSRVQVLSKQDLRVSVTGAVRRRTAPRLSRPTKPGRADPPPVLGLTWATCVGTGAPATSNLRGKSPATLFSDLVRL